MQSLSSGGLMRFLERQLQDIVTVESGSKPTPLELGRTGIIFQIILQLLELHKCFPQKLTLLKALEVREESMNESNICYDRKEYPFIIIQRILTFNYRCFVRLENSEDVTLMGI